MNSNIIRGILDPIKMLCRRVSIHDIFNYNEEEPIANDETDDEQDEVSCRRSLEETNEVKHLLTDQAGKDRPFTPVLIDETNEDEIMELPTDQAVKDRPYIPVVINETDEDEIMEMSTDQAVKDRPYTSVEINETDEDEIMELPIDQAVKDRPYTPVVINETDEDEIMEMPTDQAVKDRPYTPVEINETDEDEIMELPTDQAVKDRPYTTVVFDETDEDEIMELLTDQADKDRPYTPVVIDETDEDADEVARTVTDDKVIYKSIQNKRSSKLIFFKLANKLEKVVSKIEKLELTSCDLESDITTDFDKCVMLRLVAVEVNCVEIMNKMCKLNGSSLKAKPFDFKELTKYPEFNNKLEKLFKNNSTYPSFSKSLQYFKRCNKVYKYGISEDIVMHEIAEAAFGEILVRNRDRRVKEFTESHNCYITKYENNEIDPALLDKELEKKLLENKKNSKSISDAINEFRKKL